MPYTTLFRSSAWLWVLLLLKQVIAGFHRLTHIVLPQHKNTATLPRLKWEVAAGFALLLICVMGLEAKIGRASCRELVYKDRHLVENQYEEVIILLSHVA